MITFFWGGRVIFFFNFSIIKSIQPVILLSSGWHFAYSGLWESLICVPRCGEKPIRERKITYLLVLEFVSWKFNIFRLLIRIRKEASGAAKGTFGADVCPFFQIRAVVFLGLTAHFGRNGLSKAPQRPDDFCIMNRYFCICMQKIA